MHVTEPKPTAKRKYTDAFKDHVVSLATEGRPIKDVADEVGLPYPTVFKWIRNAGAPKRPARGGRPTRRLPGPVAKASQAKKDAVLADLDAGLPWREIAARHGVVSSTIYRWAMASGRFRFGALAPRVDVEVAGTEDTWWRGMEGIEDAPARIAVEAVSRGVTRTELRRLTGWPRDTVNRFVLFGNKHRGLPLLRLDGRWKVRDDVPDRVFEVGLNPLKPIRHVVDVDMSNVEVKATRHPAETVTEALGRMAAGETRCAVAKALGVNPDTLTRWRKDDPRNADGSLRPRANPNEGREYATGTRRPRRVLSVEELRDVAVRTAKGERFADVAAAHGISASTVYRIVRAIKAAAPAPEGDPA